MPLLARFFSVYIALERSAKQLIHAPLRIPPTEPKSHDPQIQTCRQLVVMARHVFLGGQLDQVAVQGRKRQPPVIRATN